MTLDRLKFPIFFSIFLGILFGGGQAFAEEPGSEPQTAIAWKVIGDSYYKNRDFDRALKCFEKQAAMEPPQGRARLWIANCYFAKGDFANAAKSYGQFLKTHPDSVSGQDGLGKSLYKIKEYDRAMPAFEKEIGIAPNQANGHYWMGCCLARKGRFEDAEGELRKAIGMDGKLADAYDQLGYCLIHLGRFSDALPAYNKALGLSGEDVDRTFWVGYCRLKSKDYPMARGLLQKYVAQVPQDADGHYWLASAFYQLDNYKEAQQELDRALKIEPNHLNAAELLGDTLIALKQFDKAAEVYANAVRIKPDDFYAHLWRGRALMMDVQLREGVEEIEKACQIDPQDGASRRLLASGYLVTSQYRKAWQLYPMAYATGVAVLLTAFAGGSMFLLRKSFRPQTNRSAPGLWFSLAWFLYFWDGQVMFIFLAGLLTSAFASLNVAAGMVLGPLPLLAVAVTAFPKQPWGAPFSWPAKFPWKTLGLGCLGLLAVFIFDASYVSVAPALTHLPPGHPRNVPFIQQMMQASPPMAALAVVVLAPLAEEILFRGLLFAALEERCGRLAIPASAIAFAMAHFDPYYFIPLVALGTLFGWVRYRSGTIWVGALLHMLNNAFAISSM